MSQFELHLNEEFSRRKSRGDAKAWREGDRRGETASGNEVGVGKESCELPKQSSSSLSRVFVDDADIRHANKRAVEENQSSVTDERSRCWGKAAAPNEVIFLSSSSSSPSSIVKFDVTQIYQKKKLWTDFRTETGCSSRVLNVGKAFPCCYEVAAVK
jgi:hypothetical protein